MKRGKEILMGFIFLGIIMISVGFVSAGWFGDLFSLGDDDGDLEGELRSEQTDVSLTITGTYDAPEIVWISDLGSKERSSVLPQDRDLNPGTTTSKSFIFYAYSPAGIYALPVSPTADEAYVIVENVGLGKGNGIQRKSTGVCNEFYDGDYDTSTDDIVDVLDALGNVKVRGYECNVNMQHYDDSGLDAWRVYAYIEDLQSPTPNVEGYDGTIETVNTYSLPVRNISFNLLTELAITDDTLDFGTVGFGDDLNKVPTEGDPSIENIGNNNIVQVDITAHDIPDDPDAGDYWIRSEWFYSDPDGSVLACDATTASPGSLTHSITKNTGISIIPYGVPGDTRPEEGLYLCLDKVETGATITAGSYSTTGIGGTIWNLDATGA